MCQALFSFNPYLSPRKAYEMHVISILDGAIEAHWFSQPKVLKSQFKRRQSVSGTQELRLKKSLKFSKEYMLSRKDRF